jgi:hypothetical protein
MSGLAAPLALFGLLSVPVLLAIYLLRQRSRRQSVSSLFLWQELRLPHTGGRRLRRLERSLLLLLELLLLGLLTTAATQPWRQQAQVSNRLVVVLDDSYSMQAGGTDSPRRRARTAVEDLLQDVSYLRVLWLRAGDRPELLAESSRPRSLPAEVARQWRCTAPGSRIEQALTMAFELGGPQAQILVLSDHRPADPESLSRRVRWLAFGRPAANLAITRAARSSGEDSDRCLLEIANLSDQAGQVPVTITPAPATADLQLELAPGQNRRLVFSVPAATDLVECRLPDDRLGLDNHCLLLPQRRRKVRVANQIRDARLHELVQRAAAATGTTVSSRGESDLVLSDRGDRSPQGDEWVVRLLAEPDAVAYVGPFVLQRRHPLTAGLSLEGVVWGAGRDNVMPGEPVVTAGNLVLISDTSDRQGRHTIRLRWRPELSTLQLTPDWPILIANLISWRRQALPGPERSNLRLGEIMDVTVPAAVDRLQVRAPDGESFTAPIVDRRAVLDPDQAGLWELRGGDQSFRLAVNAASLRESELRGASSGEWGSWGGLTSSGTGRRSIAWLFALIALAAAVGHQALWLGRRR